MPSPQEIAIVGRIAAQGAAEIAPALAERIALDLPEIFGGHSAKALAVIEKAPADALPLSRLAESFQHNLQKFGLPKNATPTDLFDAAREQGMSTNLLSRTGGRGHSSGLRELTLDDGHTLRQASASGRSMAFRVTSFLDREGGSVSYESGHFLRGFNQKWNISQGALRHEVNLPQPTHVTFPAGAALETKAELLVQAAK